MLNKVSLLGRVGQKPEIRTMQDGKEMAIFSIATSETWKEKGTNNKKVKTEWHRIVIFSEGLIKVVRAYVNQGSKLYVEGSIQTRRWTGQDNIERNITEIVLQGFHSRLILLDSKGQSANFVANNKGESEQVSEPEPVPGQEVHEESKNAELMEELDDEVPF